MQSNSNFCSPTLKDQKLQSEEEKTGSEALSSACTAVSFDLTDYSKYQNMRPLKIEKFYGHIFEIEEKYNVCKFIAQGSTGSILAIEDKESNDENNKFLAIKKIEKVFDHKITAIRTLRELKILRLLKHENIIGVKEILLPKSRSDFKDVYIITELMDHDLNELIKSDIEFTPDVIQFFLYQILRGVNYIHSAKIIHRDLKPHNLLVNNDCELKICDFGSSRTFLPELKLISSRYTDYITTRWYRAPELLLSWKKYGVEVDLWSIGCIFGEMLFRRPIFKGDETYQQLNLILDLIGSPNEEEIEKIPNDRTKKLIKSLPKKMPKNIEALFSNIDPLALDLLKKFLVFDPSKRITIEEALKHPYLANLYNASDEPTNTGLNPLEFEYETDFFSKEQLKDMMYEEILLYHFPDKKEEHFQKIENNESLISSIKKNPKIFSPFESDQDESSEDDD